AGTGSGAIPAAGPPVFITVTSEQHRPQRISMHSMRNATTRIASLSLAGLAIAVGATAAAASLPATAASAATSTTKVKAVETDFHIALSKSTFKPGKYVFDAEN